MSVLLPLERMKTALKNFPSMLGLAVGVSVLLSACAGTPVTDSNGKIASNEQQICRHEKLSGTNIPKSICKSAETWAAIDKAQQGTATEYTRQVSEGAAVSNAKNCGQSGGAASC